MIDVKLDANKHLINILQRQSCHPHIRSIGGSHKGSLVENVCLLVRDVVLWERLR